MVRNKLILAVGLVLCTSAVASDQGWVKDTYTNQIERQVEQQVKAERRSAQCNVELQQYRIKLAERPDSIFLQMKVEELTQICAQMQEQELLESQAAKEDTRKRSAQEQAVDRAVQQAIQSEY